MCDTEVASLQCVHSRRASRWARMPTTALADALTARLPWLAAHPTAGVHPVKVVPGDGPQGWLSQRARLLLRVPQAATHDEL